MEEKNYFVKFIAVFLLIIIFIIIVGMFRNYPRISGSADIIKDSQKYPASDFENFIRKRIQLITGKSFPTVLPEWLMTSSGTRMELDGYCEELGIAFEAQGPQHTIYSRKYYKDYSEYYKRLISDEMKARISEEYGIGLIIIDYKVPKYLIDRYIKSRIFDICRDKFLFGKYPRVDCGSLGFCGEDVAFRPYWYVEKIINRPYRDIVAEKNM